MDKEKYGVHISHCCYIHGCKYGDEDCPVVSGEVSQKHLCYDCSEEYEPYTLEELEQLRKTKSYRPTYKQLKTKLADLEAKLAESDEYIELLLEEKAGYIDIISGYADKCNQLKQQLAEKEKDFKDAEQCAIEYQDINTELEQEVNHFKGLLDLEVAYRNKLLKTKNQRAIDELEKVKEYNKTLVYSSSLIDKFIDQQIKSLKGDK